MKLRLLIAALLLVLPLSAVANPDDVEASFQAYQAALLASDGPRAADMVTRSSHQLYRTYAEQALSLDRAGLERLHVADRMSVLLMRHSLAPARLKEMSGRDIIAYAVTEGWIDKDGTAAIRLGDYRVEGDWASAALLQPDGQATPFRMEFLKEDGVWRLDLEKLLALARFGIEAGIKQTGMSEEEFLVFLLEFTTGRRPGPEIWEPPS